MAICVIVLVRRAGRLRRKVAFLAECFAQSPQAVVLVTANGEVINVNREFGEIFGCAVQEARGRRLIELTMPEESPARQGGMMELAARDQPLTCEGIASVHGKR